MKKILLALFFLAAAGVQGENILILRGQAVPPESSASFKSDTMNILLESVFTQAFDKNHIAFDAGLEAPDTLPDKAEIVQSAKKYGGDKVIAFVVFWKKGPKAALVFDRVEFLLARQTGQILTQGKLADHFEALSPDEVKDATELGQKMTDQLKSFY